MCLMHELKCICIPLYQLDYLAISWVRVLLILVVVSQILDVVNVVIKLLLLLFFMIKNCRLIIDITDVFIHIASEKNVS